jgi:hypothetical protein
MFGKQIIRYAATAVMLSGAVALAETTVTHMNFKDTALMGTFICTDDPAGITTRVMLFSGSSATRGTSGGPVTTPFTSLEILRSDGFNGLFEASGYSFSVVPSIDRTLQVGSVSGPLTVGVNSQNGGFDADATIEFTLIALPEKPSREGPFRENLDFGGFRINTNLMLVVQAASGTGSITVTDRFSSALYLTCPLTSLAYEGLPTTLQSVRGGTVTIEK